MTHEGKRTFTRQRQYSHYRQEHVRTMYLLFPSHGREGVGPQFLRRASSKSSMPMRPINQRNVYFQYGQVYSEGVRCLEVVCRDPEMG